MKILLVGAGGIMSYLAKSIYENLNKGQLDEFDVDFIIADDDTVEINQIKYQNFELEEVGRCKAEMLGKRYGFGFKNERIASPTQLEGFDAVILGVDNGKARQLIIKYCHENGIEFLDLRATGKRIFAMPKSKMLEDDMKWTPDDGKEYSCQDKSDLEKGRIQMGNQIVALIGSQMLLNLLRGHTNIKINLTV